MSRSLPLLVIALFLGPSLLAVLPVQAGHRPPELEQTPPPNPDLLDAANPLVMTIDGAQSVSFARVSGSGGRIYEPVDPNHPPIKVGSNLAFTVIYRLQSADNCLTGEQPTRRVTLTSSTVFDAAIQGTAVQSNLNVPVSGQVRLFTGPPGNADTAEVDNGTFNPNDGVRFAWIGGRAVVECAVTGSGSVHREWDFTIRNVRTDNTRPASSAVLTGQPSLNGGAGYDGRGIARIGDPFTLGVTVTDRVFQLHPGLCAQYTFDLALDKINTALGADHVKAAHFASAGTCLPSVTYPRANVDTPAHFLVAAVPNGYDYDNSNGVDAPRGGPLVLTVKDEHGNPRTVSLSPRIDTVAPAAPAYTATALPAGRVRIVVDSTVLAPDVVHFRLEHRLVGDTTWTVENAQIVRVFGGGSTQTYDSGVVATGGLQNREFRLVAIDDAGNESPPTLRGPVAIDPSVPGVVVKDKDGALILSGTFNSFEDFRVHVEDNDGFDDPGAEKSTSVVWARIRNAQGQGWNDASETFSPGTFDIGTTKQSLSADGKSGVFRIRLSNCVHLQSSTCMPTGTYVLEVFAKDKAGNVGSPPPLSLHRDFATPLIDTAQPTLNRIANVPTDGKVQQGAWLDVPLNIRDLGSGFKTVRFAFVDSATAGNQPPSAAVRNVFGVRAVACLAPLDLTASTAPVAFAVVPKTPPTEGCPPVYPDSSTILAAPHFAASGQDHCGTTGACTLFRTGNDRVTVGATKVPTPAVRVSTDGVPFGSYKLHLFVEDWSGRDATRALPQTFTVVPRAVQAVADASKPVPIPEASYENGRLDITVYAGYTDDRDAVGGLCPTQTFGFGPSSALRETQSAACVPSAVEFSYRPAGQTSYHVFRTLTLPTRTTHESLDPPSLTQYQKYALLGGSTGLIGDVPRMWRYEIRDYPLPPGSPELPDPAEIRVTVRATTTAFRANGEAFSREESVSIDIPIRAERTPSDFVPKLPFPVWGVGRDPTFYWDQSKVSPCNAPPNTQTPQCGNLTFQVSWQRPGLRSADADVVFRIYERTSACASTWNTDPASCRLVFQSGKHSSALLNRPSDNRGLGHNWTAWAAVESAGSSADVPTWATGTDWHSVRLKPGTYVLDARAKALATSTEFGAFTRLFRIESREPTVQIAQIESFLSDNVQWVKNELKFTIEANVRNAVTTGATNVTIGVMPAEGGTRWVAATAHVRQDPATVTTPGGPAIPVQRYDVTLQLPAFTHGTQFRLVANVTPNARVLASSPAPLGQVSQFPFALDTRAPTVRFDLVNHTVGGGGLAWPNRLVDGTLRYHGTAGDGVGSGVAPGTVQVAVHRLADDTYWSPTSGRFVERRLGEGPVWMGTGATASVVVPTCPTPIPSTMVRCMLYTPDQVDPRTGTWSYVDTALSTRLRTAFLATHERDRELPTDYRLLVRGDDNLGNRAAAQTTPLVFDARPPVVGANGTAMSGGSASKAYTARHFAVATSDGGGIADAKVWLVAPNGRLYGHALRETTNSTAACAILNTGSPPAFPAGRKCYAATLADEMAWEGTYRYYFSVTDRFGNAWCSYGSCASTVDHGDLPFFELADDGAPKLMEYTDSQQENLSLTRREQFDGVFWSPRSAAAGGFVTVVANLREASNFTAGYPRAAFYLRDGRDDVLIGNATMRPWNGTSVDPKAGFGMWALSTHEAGITSLETNSTLCAVIYAYDRHENFFTTQRSPGRCDEFTVRVLENVAPVVRVVSPQVGSGVPWVGREASIEVRADDFNLNPAGFEITVAPAGGTSFTARAADMEVTPVREFGVTTGWVAKWRGGNFTDGQNVTFTVRAVDNLTVANTTQFTARVDGVDPTAELVAEPTAEGADERVYAGPRTRVRVTGSDATGGSGLARLEYRVNQGAWTTYAEPFGIPSTGDSVSVDVAAVDVAGNRGVVSRTFAVDRVPPAVSVLSTGANTTITATDDLVGVDPDRVTLYYKTSEATTEYAAFLFDHVTGNTWTADLGPLTGTFIYYVEVEDRLGNVGRATVDGRTCTAETPCGLTGTRIDAPTIAFVAPHEGDIVGGPVEVRWTAQAADGANVRIRVEVANTTDRLLVAQDIVDLSGSVTLDPRRLGLADGDWRIILTIADGVNAPATASREIAVHTRPVVGQPDRPLPTSALAPGDEYAASIPVSHALKRPTEVVATVHRAGTQVSTTTYVVEDGRIAFRFTATEPGSYSVNLLVRYADGTEDPPRQLGVFTVRPPTPTDPTSALGWRPATLLVLGALAVALSAAGAFGRWRK